MSEQSSSSSSSSGTIPWPALLALAAAAGGAFLVLPPLRSSRPLQPDQSLPPAFGLQDVPARLWQDPFKVVFAAERQPEPIAVAEAGDLSVTATSTHRPSRPRAGDRADVHDDVTRVFAGAPSGVTAGPQRVLVLAVMVQADAYPELAEFRRRTRVAVLEGLGRSGYTPVDVEHIGYFRTTQGALTASPTQLAQANGAVAAAAAAALPSGAKDPPPPRSFDVPYEWCQGQRHFPMAAVAHRPEPPPWSRVLVLWLNNDAFADYPLARLSSLFQGLQRSVDGSQHVDFKVIGPHATPVFAAMVREACDASTRHDWSGLANAEVYAATPTAEDAVLLRFFGGDVAAPRPGTAPAWSPQAATEPSADLEGTTVSALLERNVSHRIKRPFHVVRTLCTDKEMSDALVDELALRGLQLRPELPKGVLSREDAERIMARRAVPDDVAVVAEWDTAYGRALPISFAMAMFPGADNREARNAILDGSAFPSWVHPFVYLRGIDGQAPDEATGDAGKKDSEKAKAVADEAGGSYRFTAPAEPPEGTNASDYLRRLADQLSDEDARLVRVGRHGLRAVGVLGTDVYDKLLILRALRDKLPGTLFFTTQYDARFSLPSEWSAAHNLIVASPYGLTLHPCYQANIPPFRASAQTSTFAATLAAMGVIGTGPLGAGEPADEDGGAILVAAKVGPPGPSEPEATTQPAVRDLAERDVPSYFTEKPRRFEIGRGGAVDLTPTAAAPTNRDASADRPGALPPPRQAIQPPRYDLQCWLTSTRSWQAVGVFLLLLAGIGWCVFLIAAPRYGAPSPACSPDQPDRAAWNALRFGLGMVPLVILAAWILSRREVRTGEPFFWLSGVSVWPTEVTRAAICALAVFFYLRIRAETRANDRSVGAEFLLTEAPVASPPPRSPVEVLRAWWPPRRPPSFNEWKVYVHRKRHATQGEALTARELAAMPTDRRSRYRVDLQRLWAEYRRYGRLPARLIRITIPLVAYLLTGTLLLYMFGLPFSPARGGLTRTIDALLLTASVLSFTAMLLYILDGAYLSYRFIRLLMESQTHWPPGLLARYDRWGLGRALTDYVDIRLIATRTRVVGRYIYYPLFLLLLVIVSRNPFFDDFDWPPGLLVLFLLNGSLALLCAWLLRHAAERARQKALTNLRASHRRQVAKGHEKKAKVLEQLIGEVKAENEGAFSILSQYPGVAAVLLPSGGLGVWLIIQYLAKSAG